MFEVLEVFDGANNIEFKEFTYIKEVSAELPVFKIKEPTIEEWNKRARKQNTKMFIQINKKLPKDYQEVLNWIYGENNESHSAGNTVTFA
jgi:hypothetical protein